MSARVDADAQARADGWADDAERRACEHNVETRTGPDGRSVGLVAAAPGGTVVGYFDYPAGVRRAADVVRVRERAEGLCAHLTQRAVRWRRTQRGTLRTGGREVQAA